MLNFGGLLPPEGASGVTSLYKGLYSMTQKLLVAAYRMERRQKLTMEDESEEELVTRARDGRKSSPRSGGY